MRVPEELLIATFDDGSHYNVSVPAMTAAVAPQALLGQAAAEMAVRKVLEPKAKQPSRLLKYELCVGGTTAVMQPTLSPS